MLGGAQITFPGAGWLYRQLKKCVDTFIQIIDRQFTDIYDLLRQQFIDLTTQRHGNS